MSRDFNAESQEEEGMRTTFLDNPSFHNFDEGQPQLDLRDVNGGGSGHFTFHGFNDDQFDTLHSYRRSGDSILLQEEHRPPSTTTTDLYHFQYPPRALPTVPDTTTPQQTGFFASEVKERTHEDGALAPHSSGLSNFPPLLPAPSSSHIVGQRFPTLRQNHASGSTVGHFDPVQGDRSNASSAVGRALSRRGRQRLSASSVSSSATSARYHPYVAPNGFEEAGHENCPLPPSVPARLVGIQRVPSGSSHRKLLSREYDARRALIQAESWLKTQIEESVVPAMDEFVIREYISSADRTRFYAFVGANPDTRRVACRIKHNVTVKGQTVACRYEAENAKDAIAHVALFFHYRGYKCEGTETGHSCDKKYPTPERRNDHYAKVKRGPDSRVACDMCSKSILERNMDRHKSKCTSRTETDTQLD